MIPHLETLEAKTFVENISIKKETFPRCHPYANMPYTICLNV